MPDDWEDTKRAAQSPFHGKRNQWSPIKGAAQHARDDIQKMVMRAPLEVKDERRIRDNLAKIRDADRGWFDNFAEQTKIILALAIEEAQRFQHDYIGTEHLLLGLVRESEGVAANVLVNLGIELSRVRSDVEYLISGYGPVVLGEIGLTPRSKKVMELAGSEARRLNHPNIGAEHLLLGLVLEGEGIAAGVLGALGVDKQTIRTSSLFSTRSS